MAFCLKCGSPMEAGNRFCDNCGAPVEWNQADTAMNAAPQPAPAPAPAPGPVFMPAPMPVAAPAPVMQYPAPMALTSQPVGANALAELDRMIGYFSRKQNEYDEYDSCIEELKTKRVQNVKLPNGIGFIVAGAVCIYMSLFFLVLVIYFYWLSSYYKSLFAGGRPSKGEGVFIFFIIMLAVMLVAGIAFLIVGIIRQKKRNRIAKESKAQAGNQTVYRLSQLVKDLEAYYAGYGFCVTGTYYTNPKILMLLKDKIVSGRAYSIENAIRMLHKDARNSSSQMISHMNSTLSAYSAYGAPNAPFFTASSFYIV